MIPKRTAMSLAREKLTEFEKKHAVSANIYNISETSFLNKMKRINNSSELSDINMHAELTEADEMVELLKKRLGEKAKYEKSLMQGIESAKSSEDVLRAQLDSEVRAREHVERQIEQLQDQVKEYKKSVERNQKKEVAQVEEINSLELQMKDLKMTYDQTVAKEHKAEINLHESEKRSRDLERELIHVRIENARLQEQYDLKQQESHELELKCSTARDKLIREVNATKIKVIAMKKNYAECVADIEKLQVDLKEGQTTLENSKAEHEKAKAVLEAIQAELDARLVEEERATEILCAELTEKNKQEMHLTVQTETCKKARVMLSETLAEKTELAEDLGKRLSNLQGHLEIMEERMEEKYKENSKLAKELEHSESNLNLLKLQLSKERHNKAEQERALKREQSNAAIIQREILARSNTDKQMLTAVNEAEVKSQDLSDQLQACEEERQKYLAEITHTNDKMYVLRQKYDGVQKALKNMKLKLTLKKEEYDSMDKELKKRSKEFVFNEHEAKLKATDLRHQIAENTERLQVLKNTLDLNEIKIKDSKSVLHQVCENAEFERQNLSQQIQELKSANALIATETEQEKHKGRALENDLISAENRLREALAAIGAQEKKSQGLNIVNQEEQDRMMQQLRDITAQIDDMNQKTMDNRSEIRDWQVKLNDTKQEKMRIEEHLSSEQAITKKLRDQLEEKMDIGLSQKSKIAMLEQHNHDLDINMSAISKEEEKVRCDVDEIQSKVDVLKQEVRDAELRNQTFYNEQQATHRTIMELESSLKTQESQHIADARAVKLSIVSLQDALLSKVNIVESLVHSTRATQAKAKSVQKRLDDTNAAAAASQGRYQTMLMEEQRTTAALRQEIETQMRNERVLQQHLLKKDQQGQELQTKLAEQTSRTSIIQSDALTKRKEADMVMASLEKKTSREKEMMSAINERSEEILGFRTKQREEDMKEKQIRTSLKQTEFENNLLKKQIAIKMRSERVALVDIEAERVHLKRDPENEVNEFKNGSEVGKV